MPDLAESFTVSDDGHSYTFRIRTDATWSDGEPVTAADVAFAWQRLIGEAAVGAFWLEGIVAEATGERTLELRIDEPRNYLLHLLTVPPLVPWPRHVVEREGPEWHRQVPLVGNGPFVLTSVGSDHVVLEAAEAWYGDRGNVLEVTVVLAAPGSALRGAWRRGRYDVLDDTLSVAASDDKQTRIERSPGMQTWYLGFDAIRPPLDDPRLRRAIAHAIDRQAVAGAMVWNATGTGGLIPPQIPGHSQRVAPPLDRDRAHALLAEAGDPGEIVLAGLDLWEPATAEIGAQLRTLGMRVQMRTFESDPELANALGDPVSAYVWAWGADFPDPGGGVLEAILRDLPLYRDEQLLRLLERARSFTDRDERLRLYREFERIWIGEQAAVVPLGYQDRLFWRRPWIHGLWANTVAMSTFASANVDRSVALVDRA